MVGLSVVLEAQKGSVSKKTPQVINKTTMLSSSNINNNKHSSSSSSVSVVSLSQHSPFQEAAAKFLDQCFLCRKRLLPGKDIYMYKGDRAFCSVECRCKQIFMDEEESVNIQKDKCCSFTSSSATN
ncbi:hypothetical protein AAZX31_09G042200 [Glycine max]|uniref:FLZ-type domain-containing protein n=1 Tax=Glycine max TaxID=3847 RepID=I1L0X7_SOYBN|nr:FCS-Like Zinc finger 15 [Glycine max]KAG5006015.1 hypothetical protein JHK85_024557 [Glycine max]KAG5011806.1 hypothetical protein JHK86_024067 [Glycine max]KAH1041436.1 hypothetical protein GYH30_024006 [Glycine max]KAH1231942.1 Protein MARD1 [Glycine max]KRH37075.1 hypothetical protein GLYMA_09G042900v4 [Glycine max]|eukprot:XP_006586915.1 uncharacterized protein LOC102670271 [Glycine max]